MIAKKAKSEYDRIKEFCLAINVKTGAFHQHYDEYPAF